MVQNKPPQDITPHIPPVAPIRARPAFAQHSIPSARINHRLQAKLARIRRLAALEMEKKAAAAIAEQITNKDSVSLDPVSSQDGSSARLGHNNIPFKLNAKQDLSDVHVNPNSTNLIRSKPSDSYIYPSAACKRKSTNTEYRHCGNVNDFSLPPLKRLGSLRNSCSMVQCKKSTEKIYNLYGDGIHEQPKKRSSRLRSLQTLSQQDQHEFCMLPFESEKKKMIIASNADDSLSTTKGSTTACLNIA